METVSSRRERH